MMKELFLLKLGEIVLKGQNRRVFEDKLKTNTRRRMSKFGQFRVTITQSTLYVEPLNDECDVDGAWEACGAIFGIASMCRCRACEKDLDAIFRTVVEYLGDELSLPKASRSSPSARTSASRSTRFRFRRKSAAESPRNSRTSRSMSTTRCMSSTSRSAKRPPTSTDRPRPARAGCPPARAGARRCCSPAASTRRSRAI